MLRLQVNAGLGRLGQAIERHRRLKPAPVAPALQVIEDLPAIEHRHRVTKGESLSPGGGRVQHLTRDGWRLRGQLLARMAAFTHLKDLHDGRV
jgi:hypothetical protein